MPIHKDTESENYSSSNLSEGKSHQARSRDSNIRVKQRHATTRPASCDLVDSSESNENGSQNETAEINLDHEELEGNKKINCIKGQAYKMQQYKNSSKVVNSRIDQEQVEWTANGMW